MAYVSATAANLVETFELLSAYGQSARKAASDVATLARQRSEIERDYASKLSRLYNTSVNSDDVKAQARVCGWGGGGGELVVVVFVGIVVGFAVVVVGVFIVVVSVVVAVGMVAVVGIVFEDCSLMDTHTHTRPDIVL